MVQKTVAPKKTAAKAPAKKAGLKVVIDYPAAHEIVRPGHYAIRLTAAGATQAQVRFDGDKVGKISPLLPAAAFMGSG